jgi:hypothetical protein
MEEININTKNNNNCRDNKDNKLEKFSKDLLNLQKNSLNFHKEDGIDLFTSFNDNKENIFNIYDNYSNDKGNILINLPIDKNKINNLNNNNKNNNNNENDNNITFNQANKKEELKKSENISPDKSSIKSINSNNNSNNNNNLNNNNSNSGVKVLNKDDFNKSNNSSNKTNSFKFCRFCWEEENEEKGNLIRPCLCDGTMKYIHQSCLKTWVENNLANNKLIAYCEICQLNYQMKIDTKYVFSNEKCCELVKNIITSIIFYGLLLSLVFLIIFVIVSSFTSIDTENRGFFIKFLIGLEAMILFGIFLSNFRDIRSVLYNQIVTNWEINSLTGKIFKYY